MITKINWKRISAFFLALAVTLTTCFSNLYLSEKKVYADSASSFEENPYYIFKTSKNSHNNEVYEEFDTYYNIDYVYFASEGTYNSGSTTRYETVGMKVTWNGCSVYLASDQLTQGGLLHVSKTKNASGDNPTAGETCYTAYRINYMELYNFFVNSFPNGDFSSLKDNHSDKILKFDSILAVKKLYNGVWNYEGRLKGNGVAYDPQGNPTGIVQGAAADNEDTWKKIWTNVGGTVNNNFNNLWNMWLNIKYANQVFPQPKPEPNISLISYVAVETENTNTAYTDNGKLYFRSTDSGGSGQKIHFSIFQSEKRNDGRISKITGQVRKIGSDTNSAFTYDWSIAGGNQNTFFNSVYGGTLNRKNSDSDGLNIQSSRLLNDNCHLEVCLNAAFRGAGEYQVQHVIAYTFTNDDKYIIQYSPEANSDKFYVDAVGPTLRINNSEKIPSKLYTATYGGISYDFSAVDKLYTGDYNQSNRGSGVKKITLTSPDGSETTIYENGKYTNNQYKKNISYQFPEGKAGNYTFTLTDNVGNVTQTTVNVVDEKPNINTGNLTITKKAGQALYPLYYSTENNNYYIKSESEVNYSFPVKANGLTITGYALTDDGNLLGTNKLINDITDNDKDHFYFVTSLSGVSFRGFSYNHIIKSVDNITQNGNGAKGSFKFENIEDNQKVIPNAYAEGKDSTKNYYYSAGGSATIITDDQAPKIINLADESVKDNTLIAGKTYHFIVKDYTKASYDENGNIVENPEEGSGISDNLTKVYFRGSSIGNLNNDKTELVFTVPKKNVSNKDLINIQLTDNVGNQSSYTFSVNKNAMEITNHTLTSNTDNIYQPDVTKQNYWVRQDSSVYDNFRANTYFGNDTAFYTDKMSMLVRPVGSSDTTSFSITGIIPKSITDSELKTLDEVTFENNVENYLIKNNASATFLKDNGLSTTTSLNTLSFKNHGDKLELIPKADSDTKTTGWDENKKIEVYVDGKAPEVTEAIKETRVHSEVRTYKFTDADSGVRSFNIYKTMNHTSDPNNVHKLVYTATADEIKNGTLEYEFFDDGNYQIEVVDNVGNIAYPNMIDITKKIYSSNAEITNSDKDYIYFVTTNNNGTDDTSDDEGYYWVGLNKDVNIKMSSETNYSNEFFRPTRNILVFDKTLSNPLITNIYSNPDNQKSAILTSRKEYTTSTDKTTFDLNGKILTTENKVQFLTNGKTYDIQTFARSLYNENDVLAESDYTYTKPLTIKTDGNAPTINTPTQSITNNNINYTFTTEDNQSGLKENSFILYDVNRKIVKTIDKKETSTNSATYHFTKSGYYYLVSEDNVGNKSAKRVHVIDEDNPDPEPPVPPIIVTPPDIEIYLESIKVKSVSFVENANTYKLSDKEFWIKSDTNVVLNEISKTSYFSDIFQPTDHLFNNGSTDGSNILINVTNPNGLTTLNKRINNIENATLGNTSITKKATKDDSTFGTKMEISFNDTLAEYNFIPGAVAKYKGFILAETNYNEQENIDKQLKIHVDGIKPTIANAPVITFKNGKLIYTFSAKDNESGLKNITIVNNNSSKTVANTTTGKAGAALIPEVPYTITATDNVGNVSTMTYMVGAMNIKINTKIDISGTNVYKDGDINWVKSNKNVNLKITSETSYSNTYFYPTKNMYVLANKADKDNLPDIGILTSPFREYTIKNNVYTNNFDKTDKMNTTKITSNYSNNKKTFTTNATAQFKADFEKYVMYPYAESKFDTTIFTKTTYDTNQLITIYTDGIAPIINKVPTQSITSSSIFYTFNTKDNESGF